MTQEDVAIVGALLGLLASGEALPPAGTLVTGTDLRRYTDDENPVKPFTAVNVSAVVTQAHRCAANAAYATMAIESSRTLNGSQS